MQNSINDPAPSRGAKAWTTMHRLAAGAILAVLTGSAAMSCGAESEEEFVGELELGASTPVTVSFQDGVAPTSSYAGTTDTSLKQASPTTNFGTQTTLYLDGDDGSGVDLSSLIRWSLTGIPAGSTVQSASITVRIVDTSNNNYQIYGVLKSWSESQATWQRASTATAWQTAGAMGAADRGAQVGTLTGSNGLKTVTLNAAGVALVQSWVNGGANNGIIVANSSNTNGLDFGSSERTTTSYRPTLTITYLPPDTDAGGGTGGAAGSAGTAGTAGSAGSSGAGGSSGSGGTGGGISTDPNLKIGFIGDTATGSSFTSVLNLIKNEGASAIVVEGDMSYSANPTTWWNQVESVLGTTFPIFLSRGNHDDSSWSGYLPKANAHLGGATRVAGAHDANYKTTYRGLVIATIQKGDSGARITPFLQGDNHIWKVCNWHQNQAAMQVGGKGDEMGWDVYETCRQQGAIVVTGHEHSYSRTRTLINTSTQTVDGSCNSPTSLCVGPGRTFVTVAGLGGNSVRDQTRCLPSTFPYGCKGEWAFIHTNQQAATHGAQFMTFNAGNPRVATGYFKNVNGQTVDTFTINHD